MLKLEEKNEVITTVVEDAEMDLIECEFTNGGTVQLKTSELAYVDLSVRTLRDLADAIERAEKRYTVIFDEKEEE